LVALTAGEPRVLTIQDGRALPSGPFELQHRAQLTALLHRPAALRTDVEGFPGQLTVALATALR
jgi:hypothetical protein